MAVHTSRSVALVVAPVRGARTGVVGAAAAIAIGAAGSALIVPVGTAAIVGIVGLAGLVVVRAGAARCRAGAIARESRRARTRRRRSRERAIAHSGAIEREALAELVRLVEAIEAADSDLAVRLELDDLLDRYVALGVAHERALGAVRMFDRALIEHQHDLLRADPATDPRRLDLCERRLRCHDQCQARADELANELAMIAELVKLVAQRATCPDEPTLDDRIDRSLSELDEDDAAQRQLAGELP